MGLAQRRQQKQTILLAWICQKSLCFLPTDESCHFSSSSQCLSLAERREKENGKKKKELKKKRKPQILKVIITNLPLSEVAVWLSVVTAVL